MQENIQKIRALHAVNEEIITAVEATETVTYYDYNIIIAQNGMMEIKEVVTVTPVSQLLSMFKFSGKFRTDIWDLFNDKLNWKASGWEDLKRINREALAVVEKFEMLTKGVEKPMLELSKYLINFEILQVGLGEMQQRTTSQQSQREEMQAECDEINLKIQKLIGKGARPCPESSPNFSGGTLLQEADIDKLVGWYGPGWRLQYKASKHGWKSSQFHEYCDGKGSTVTVIKANDCLFGGYLSVPWQSSGGYVYDPLASIFTLKNKHEFCPTRLPVEDPGHAALYHSDCGPVFGAGYDIFFAGTVGRYQELTLDGRIGVPKSYEDVPKHGQMLFVNDTNFKPQDIEVYVRN